MRAKVRHPPLSDFLNVAPEDMVGVSELAELLGVTKRTAIRYSQRPDFPAPLARLAAGPVWKRADVEKWAKMTLPLPRTGRPPKSATS
jgi:predicted DNA-binding transcriptional regulator AlpA